MVSLCKILFIFKYCFSRTWFQNVLDNNQTVHGTIQVHNSQLQWSQTIISIRVFIQIHGLKKSAFQASKHIGLYLRFQASQPKVCESLFTDLSWLVWFRWNANCNIILSIMYNHEIDITWVILLLYITFMYCSRRKPRILFQLKNVLTNKLMIIRDKSWKCYRLC